MKSNKGGTNRHTTIAPLAQHLPLACGQPAHFPHPTAQSARTKVIPGAVETPITHKGMIRSLNEFISY